MTVYNTAGLCHVLSMNLLIFSETWLLLYTKKHLIEKLFPWEQICLYFGLCKGNNNIISLTTSGKNTFDFILIFWLHLENTLPQFEARLRSLPHLILIIIHAPCHRTWSRMQLPRLAYIVLMLIFIDWLQFDRKQKLKCRQHQTIV